MLVQFYYYQLYYFHLTVLLFALTNNFIFVQILLQDVNWLVSKLPNVKDVYYIDNIKFGHLSFVMHENIEWLVNSRIKNALSTNSFN